MSKLIGRILSLRLSRYIIAGVCVAIIYSATIFVCEYKFGFPLAVSILIAYVVAATLRFIVHRAWVFGATHGAANFQIARYLILLAVSYLINVALVEFFFSKYFGNSIFIAILSGLVGAAFSYLASINWVFRK